MKVILLLVFVVLATLVQSQAPICPKDSVLVGNFCSCFSGYIGANCTQIENSVCTFPTVAPLATSPVAEIISPSVSNNQLSFTIASPATASRYFQYISLTPGYLSNCSYPGPSFTKSFNEDDCTDRFTGTFTIPQLVNTCMFDPIPAPVGTASYLGSIQVAAVDALSSLRGHTISRVTKASHLIQLDLPTSVNITTVDLTVLSAINLESAVTGQEYNFDAKTATVTITTSVQYPYILYAPSISEGPNSGSAVTSEIECFESSGDCLQSTVITLSLPNDACDFSGVYILDLSYTCRNDLCDASVTPSSVSFTLDSGNICGTATVLATLTGDLESYKGADHSVQSSIFIANDIMHFVLSLTADVQVESFAIKRLDVIIGGLARSLIADSTITPLGTSASYSSTPSPNQAYEAFFSFAAYVDGNDGIFPAVADAIFTFDVEVGVEVTYKTTFGGGRKRDVSQTVLSAVSTLVFDGTHSKL